MHNDPTRNVVMFRLGPNDEDRVSAEVAARAADGVRQAWRAVVAEHGARAETVTEVSSTWQPSVLDSRFLEVTFDRIEVRYRFERPRPDGWDEAFAAARRAADAERSPTETADSAAFGGAATDPTVSGIVFARGENPDDAVVAFAPARDDDAVQQAWRQVVKQHGVRADEVTAVAAEWQPSDQDGQFISATRR